MTQDVFIISLGKFLNNQLFWHAVIKICKRKSTSKADKEFYFRDIAWEWLKDLNEGIPKHCKLWFTSQPLAVTVQGDKKLIKELLFWGRIGRKLLHLKILIFFGLIPKTGVTTCCILFYWMREGIVEVSYPAAPQFWLHTELSILVCCLESNGTEGTRNRINVGIIIKYQHFLS